MSRDPDTIDFAVDELEDLHQVLASLRSRGPVSRIRFAGKPIWLVTGYADLKSVVADDEILSAPAAYKELLEPSMGSVLPTMTGQQHRHNRSAVASVFFPRKMRQLSETVFAAEATKLVEQLHGRAEVDLVADYTRPYTFNNITRLLGLPAEDAPRLQDWAERIMHSFIDLPAAISACAEMGEYLAPLVAARREKPEEDLISLLVMTEVDGQGLSDEEVFSFCRNLFPASIDTSANSLGSLLAVVIGDAGLKRRALAGDSEREALVNELLRWEPPLVMVPRQCVKDFELGGETLRRGDDVRLCISAANRDEVSFANPNQYDPDRDSSHMAFGHGEHFCLGSHMARRVLETGLHTLLSRFPDIALTPDRPPAIRGGVLRGPHSLWVTL
jgi:cytochrome P450